MHTSVSPKQSASTSNLAFSHVRNSARPGKRLHYEVALVFALLIAGLLMPESIRAQACKGNINEGCTNPGAVFKPVSVGTGQTGHCKTPELPKGERECQCVG